MSALPWIVLEDGRRVRVARVSMHADWYRYGDYLPRRDPDGHVEIECAGEHVSLTWEALDAAARQEDGYLRAVYTQLLDQASAWVRAETGRANAEWLEQRWPGITGRTSRYAARAEYDVES